MRGVGGPLLSIGDLLSDLADSPSGDSLQPSSISGDSPQSSHHSLLSKGVDELVAECRVGSAAKDKLRKVIEWVKLNESAYFRIYVPGNQNVQFTRNWKLPEQRKSRACVSLSEVSRLTESCKAVFYASVGEIFLPLTSRNHAESVKEKDKMFIRRRLYELGDTDLVTDLICTGCQLCGSPLNHHHEKSMLEQDSAPLYCSESSNRLHVVSFIYKPFMLYVWDESEHLPLLVRNKAAELLFGNVKAERVYSSFREKQDPGNVDPICNAHSQDSGISADSSSGCLGAKRKPSRGNDTNFHLIWIILMKVLLQRGKNSPLKFEVTVNTGLDKEKGMFEVISVWMPCFGPKVSLNQTVQLKP